VVSSAEVALIPRITLSEPGGGRAATKEIGRQEGRYSVCVNKNLTLDDMKATTEFSKKPQKNQCADLNSHSSKFIIPNPLSFSCMTIVCYPHVQSVLKPYRELKMRPLLDKGERRGWGPMNSH
jgi:hypothetical protein